MKIWFLPALIMLAACAPDSQAPAPQGPKGVREADARAARHLQSLATSACECARKAKGDQWWEPGYEDMIEGGNPPPPCWQKFASAIRPYRFDGAAVAACGPGSDTSGVILGRDRAFLGREGGWTVEDENGQIVERGDPPKDRPLEIFELHLRYGFSTCTPAQFAKAKADYEAKSNRPGCG